MKLKTGDGGYIDARELISYDIRRDVSIVLHSVMARRRQHDCTGEIPVLTQSDEARRAILAEIRRAAGVALGDKLRGEGCDYSESVAPPVPRGMLLPAWAE